MVIDLKPGNRFIKKLEHDIINAAEVAKAILEHYESPKQQGFLNTFTSLKKEIENLNQTHVSIIESFSDYKSMHRRQERSVLPFCGLSPKFFIWGSLRR